MLLRQAFGRHSVLVFRNQALTEFSRLCDLASVFGNASACNDITNLNPDGSIVDPESLDARYTRGNSLWHMDMLVLERPPAAAMLLARELPTSGGGQTQFADLEGTWRSLPAKRKRDLKDLFAVHTLEIIRERMGITDPQEITSEYPPGIHPLVCFDPISGSHSFFFGAHTSHIRGLPERDGEALLVELHKIATAESNVYTHTWHCHDLVLWSNRRVMHRVLPYDYRSEKRRLWRVEVLTDERPVARNSRTWCRLWRWLGRS